MRVNIYATITNYYVDVWEDETLVAEYQVNKQSDDSIQQVRDFVSKYDYTDITDKLGLIR